MFLGSQMSRFINGEELYVNGGIYARAHKQGMQPVETWAPPVNELRRKDG